MALNMISNITERHSDVDLIAGWARQALELDRIELATELLALARRADQAGRGRRAAADLFGNTEARMVPLVGQTRDEAPRDGSHAPTYCCHTLRDGQDNPYACGAPIRWHDPSMGVGRGEWAHLDPEITDHPAQAHPY